MEAAPTQDYSFSRDQQKGLSAPEQTELIKTFKFYDKNGDGTLNLEEFKNIMIDLGHRKTTDDDAKKMLTEYDKEQNGVLSWPEFVDMMIAFKGDKSKGDFGKLTGDKAIMENKEGGKHTYSVEEVYTFASMVNNVLEKDEDCQDHLPIKTDGDDIFHVFSDGIVLCKLAMAIEPDCIDSRAINKGKQLNAY